MKLFQNKVILSGALILLIAGTLITANILSNLNTKRKIDLTKVNLKKIEVGVNSKYVDDCSGFSTDSGNYLPVSLTTPIAYVSPSITDDPFSKGKEKIRFINQLNRGNGAQYLIVSRGPDQDWDIDRMPLHANIPKGFYPPTDAAMVKTLHSETPAKAYHGYRYEEAEYYINKKGDSYPVPKMDVLILPVDTTNSGWMRYKELIEYLEKSDISIYDPTNGLKSNGDIIVTDSRE